jgi:cytidine deaminase
MSRRERSRGRDAGVADADWIRLEDAAKAASKLAYCPYSRFPVGAAALTAGGAIVAGCNVENASYGLTICAERNAVCQAVARGEREIRAVVVYTPTPTPTAPCGACRQVLNEFGPEAEVRCLCDGPDQVRALVSDLLPEAFGPKNLG